MREKSIIIFAFIVLMSIPIQVASAQYSGWLTIENEYFKVYYKSGYRADAEQIMDYCLYARNVTMKVYPHQLDTKVTVNLYDIQCCRCGSNQYKLP